MILFSFLSPSGGEIFQVEYNRSIVTRKLRALPLTWPFFNPFFFGQELMLTGSLASDALGEGAQ
jgi:hypothetical protein